MCHSCITRKKVDLPHTVFLQATPPVGHEREFVWCLWHCRDAPRRSNDRVSMVLGAAVSSNFDCVRSSRAKCTGACSSQYDPRDAQLRGASTPDNLWCSWVCLPGQFFWKKTARLIVAQTHTLVDVYCIRLRGGLTMPLTISPTALPGRRRRDRTVAFGHEASPALVGESAHGWGRPGGGDGRGAVGARVRARRCTSWATSPPVCSCWR